MGFPILAWRLEKWRICHPFYEMHARVLLAASRWAGEGCMKGMRQSWEYMGLAHGPYSTFVGLWATDRHMGARLAVYAFSTSCEKHARRPGYTDGELKPLSSHNPAIATRHPRKTNLAEEVGRLGVSGALYEDESKAFRRHSQRSPMCGKYRMFFN